MISMHPSAGGVRQHLRRRSSETTDKEQDESRRQAKRRFRLGLILLILVVAVVTGILTGNWLADARAVLDERRRVDEHLGLGERTGLTGEIALLVDPMKLAVRAGEPVKVNLTLTNKGKEPVTLNGWFTPAPSEFESNQLPFKVIVSALGRRVEYRGDPVLFPPHTKKDFVTLGAGESKVIAMDLSRGPGSGRWDLSAPGVYKFEVWYETYLTGRYVGVNAWTGMTNHVIVEVTVQPREVGAP